MTLVSLARRSAAAAALLIVSFVAGAGELPFTKPAFDSALAAGKPVVVHFRAPWCPTCKAQKPIVGALLADPKRQGVTLFAADYDTEAALKQRLHVAEQSTFVVFKGGKEVGRSTGQTNKEAIAGLFDKAL